MNSIKNGNLWNTFKIDWMCFVHSGFVLVGLDVFFLVEIEDVQSASCFFSSRDRITFRFPLNCFAMSVLVASIQSWCLTCFGKRLHL